MNEQDSFDDPIDRLVRQYLQAEERRVDTDALLEGAWNSAVEGLMEELSRRRARRRIVRLAPRILAAAAVLLVAATFIIISRTRPKVAGSVLAVGIIIGGVGAYSNVLAI